MVSFGENLRRERKLRGVELSEIARSTKIAIRFLQALESDRLDILPGGLFSRAFVRQYAAHLGLDVERTLADFVSAHAEPQREPARATPSPSRQQLRRAGLIAGASALCAILLFTGRATTRPRPAALPMPALLGSVPSVYSPSATEDERAHGLALTLRAVADCWVEARVDGQGVLRRVLTEGETTTIAATQEILLSVGNAGGLTVSVNDQAGQPLGRHGEVRRNIRITRDSLSSFLRTPVTVASSVSG